MTINDRFPIGTPTLGHYGNRGFISRVIESAGNTFVLGAGRMEAVREEYEICWEAGRVETLSDGIVGRLVERAKAANLPIIDNVDARRADILKRQNAARAALSEKAKRDAEELAAFRLEAQERIPSWAKAVIVAELVEDQSDSMTDYFASTTKRVVYLGFSKHTRDLFPELRKFAATFPETAHLATAPDSAEHREKYSMGAGYYLKSGFRHSNGWKVRKMRLYDGARSLPKGEWHLPCAPKPQDAPAPGAVRIEEHIHSKKGFAMFIAILPNRVEREEFDRLRDAASALGGWYSRPWGRTPGGFAFKERASAESFARGIPARDEASKPSMTSALPAKFRSMAERMQGDIDSKLAERRMNTPKQQREAASARIDGRHLERTQSALRKLAELHESGTVPPALAHIRSKAEVHALTRSKIDRSNAGYYDAGIDTDSPALDNDAARALWDLLKPRSAEEKAAEDLREKIASLRFSNIPGFFPTPAAVVERMIFEADMPTGEFRFLEPEGGSGAILDIVRARFKRATIDTFECHNTLREILIAKGYSLIGGDFLGADAAPLYDRILMNPPFEKGQDMEHVRHAYSFLKPGGRLVAIMSPGPFFRADNKAEGFRAWFEEVGGTKIDLPANSFKESGTGTATVMVAISRD